jgi:hypothetical protein
MSKHTHVMKAVHVDAWRNDKDAKPPAWVATTGIDERDLADHIPQGHYIVRRPAFGGGYQTSLLSPEQFAAEYDPL